MRRLLVALASMALAGGVVLVLEEATDRDIPYDQIRNCSRPRVMPPPAVIDAGEVEGVRVTVVSPVRQAIAMAALPDRVHAIVVARTGKAWSVHLESGQAHEMLDLGPRLGFGPEGGLLAVAVDPEGRFAYMHYTDRSGTSRIVEYTLDGPSLDRSSERDVLALEHPQRIHNGGSLVFGPDGALYIGFGDGGDRPADADRAEDPGRLDGKILRIDPRPRRGDSYVVPRGNPYAGVSGARPEIWARGLRNPWQFSFDRDTGDLWVGDVGSNCYEEIDLIPAGMAAADLGYPRFEAFHAFLDDEADRSTFPVYAYEHGPEGCAVIGGVVYRGSRIPQLAGAYLMADYCAPGIRWLRRSQGSIYVGGLLPDVRLVQSFAQNLDGEVYLLSAVEGLIRLDPA